MGSRWIVKRGDVERGPFTSPQLRSLANSGQLRRTDLVTKQGEDRYVPAEKVKGLFSPPSENPLPSKPFAKPKVPAKSQASDDEVLDFGVVEIIEDDEPVIVLDESNDEFDFVTLDDRGDDDDYEEPKPTRSGRSRTSRPAPPPPRGRGNSSSRRAPAKPAKPKKSPKKGEEGEEDDENGPWLNLVYGSACVFGGICFFIALGNEDPNTWETRRGAALVAVVRLLYNIGGRWTVLGLAIAISCLFFWSAIDQFRKA